MLGAKADELEGVTELCSWQSQEPAIENMQNVNVATENQQQLSN